MVIAPVVTIFVRHASDCKYAGDEFAKRCTCRKHFRWSQNGKQYRRKAGTRAWGEAEQLKRELEDQLAGRTPERNPEDSPKGLQDAVDVFLKDKKLQGITADVLDRYTRELDRLRVFCERNGVFTVQGITRELLAGYVETWDTLYRSTYTRAVVRMRIRSFLRYCYDVQWLQRVPTLPRLKVDEVQTMPLSADEYARLLDAIYGTIPKERYQQKVHALIQLMRFSGLAIRDAVTLKRKELQFEKAKGLYRIVTSRQKTGIHVSVPIPPDVAEELIALPNSNPEYFFWDGKTKPEHRARGWTNRFIVPLFNAADIPNGGHMKSHRFRDTFAVELLQQGVPLEEVSKLLGHTSIRTTEKSYARWVQGRQDRLDNLVTGTWKKTKLKNSK